MNTINPDAIDNLPLDLKHPGGLVEKVMNYINETAICPQPLFALASALTLCGLLFGRRFADESNQRTNLFFMGVGGTSSGKDYALKAISNILSAAKCNDLWLSEFTSDSALEHALKRQPRLVLLIDEAGHFSVPSTTSAADRRYGLSNPASCASGVPATASGKASSARRKGTMTRSP